MAYELKSDQYVMKIEKTTVNEEKHFYGIGFYRVNQGKANKLYEQKVPLSVWIKQDVGDKIQLEEGYHSVENKEDKLICSGTVHTPNGSLLSVEDTYAIFDKTGSFDVSRKVHVIDAGPGDAGFTSRLSINPIHQSPMEDYDMFAPGVWYRMNENVVENAIASDYNDSYFYIREMRLSLPIFMMKHREMGDTLTIGHIDAKPSSHVDEASDQWLVDESIQYGSLGIHKNKYPRLDFVYPGWEGEVNYINRDCSWILRSHPIKTDVIHEYRLVLKLDGKTEAFADTMKRSWRYFFDIFKPEVKSLDINQIYENSIHLLETYYNNYNGVYGLPFKATVREGEITGHAMVMGFVGQQLPAAYQMIRYGLRNSRSDLVEKGSTMINFWVNHSMTDSGLPLTWYEPYFEKTGVFVNSTVDLRTMSDGMEGVVDAYQYMKKHGTLQEDWLNYMLKFGNWLVDNQNDDGSFYRIYDLEGNPVHLGPYNTTNPIRFLVKLYETTDQTHFLNTAVRAGEYAYKRIYQDFNYVGGTSDNNNTIDKEAGTIAMNAFLSLYDATDEEKWLQAFQGAADYAETWTFAWSYHVNSKGSHDPFPESSLVGHSLVASGHSYVDMYMAYKSAQYYRLALLTKDPHYVHFARILQHNTNQTADSQGKWNYKHPGLIEEGQAVTELSYKGIDVWLVWCTIAQIEPLSELEDMFGSMSVDELGRRDRSHVPKPGHLDGR